MSAEISASPPSRRSTVVDGRSIVRSNGWLKTARIFDEIWLDAPPLVSPASLVEHVRGLRLGADLFTFGQPLPAVAPLQAYSHDFDSIALADTSDFAAWWEALPQESRKNVRKAHKRGVTIASVPFSDDLVRGIKILYDEMPVRQGRRFWHYGKDLSTVKRENSSYLERSELIGAFLDGQLIGFLKMVYAGGYARIMQILSLHAHLDKHPTNALLAAAVEACARRPVAGLIYGQYVYGNKATSSVMEFKRRNGFREVLLPRYYVPFTLKGRIAIASGAQRGLARLVPEPLIQIAREARTFVYTKFAKRPAVAPILRSRC